VSSANTRIPGILYLLNAVTGAFSIFFVTRTFLIPGNGVATVEKIAANEALYRAGLASDLLSQVLFVLLGFSLYKVFGKVQPGPAKLLLTFILASLPIAGVCLVLQATPLVLLHATPQYFGLSPEQAATSVLAALGLRNMAISLVSIFWGLWLLPFAAAVLRSGYIPRTVGYLLLAAGVAYAGAALLYVLLPQFRGTVGPASLVVAAVGELSTIAWLLAKGIPRGEA
jgi:Domain of unknown function (DUF4386)